MISNLRSMISRLWYEPQAEPQPMPEPQPKPEPQPWVVDYPVDGPLWADGIGLPALHQLLESRERRLARLTNRLATEGVDLAAGLAADRPEPLARALDDWIRLRWPDVADKALAEPERWDAQAWDDAAAPLYTLILDLGVALGELAIRHRPTLAWGVNDDPLLKADGDPCYMGVMPLGPYRADGSGPTVAYDAFAEAFMSYQWVTYRQPPTSFLDELMLKLEAGKPR
jgi:hypothetical protein